MNKEIKSLIKKVKNRFWRIFKVEPLLIFSPGRVNLIGEHTDYNGGFVLPAAIDKGIIFALAQSQFDESKWHALDKNEVFTTDLHGEIENPELGWQDYLLGIVHQLRSEGYEITNFNCVFSGNIPIGAGMSSSAALESGLIVGLDHMMKWGINRLKMAKICQATENRFIGVQSGIMDQFASLLGKENQVVKLDCRSLEYEYFPFDQDEVRIVLCDTGVRRELASSEYNIRKKQCEDGVRVLQDIESSITSLRDVGLEFLKKHGAVLDEVIYNRCRYVVEENERVRKACRYIEERDMRGLGELMFLSHDGLRDLYEVSCKELDILVQEANLQEEVLGARMMGGGFGGCTINLVEKGGLEQFKEKMTANYKKQVGIDLRMYEVVISEGTELMNRLID